MLSLAFENAELAPDEHVRVDPRFSRPTEVDLLLADATKARTKLGWKAKTGFEEIVRCIVDHDIELAAQEKRAVG